MQPDRPVRLTFPANDSGWRRIMAGALQVGYVRRDCRWTAYLWAHADDRHGGSADAPVSGESLAEIRAGLRERLERKGPWWT
jgi:hypothetical protein